MGRRVCTSSLERIGRLIIAGVLAGGLAGACGASNPSLGTATESSRPGWLHTGNGQGCLIGVSYFNSTDLIEWVGPALQKSLTGAGANYEEADAKAMPDSQGPNIDGLIAAGAKVIVMEPGPEDSLQPALQRAAKAGIPVVTVFSPLQHFRSLYVAFDPVEQGRQEARGLLAVKPKGDYAIIKGDSSSLESELIASGIREILQPAVDSGDIKIVATIETPNSDWDLAQQELRAILSQNGGRVDAVALVDDEMTYPVRSTLGEAGLAGSVAVGGVSNKWGGASGLIAIARGTQAVDAWGNPERVGKAAAEAAMALCHNPDITKVAGSASVSWPGRDPMTAILLAPVVITRDNLDTAVQTSTEWRKLICGYDSVPAPDWAPACQGWTPQP